MTRFLEKRALRVGTALALLCIGGALLVTVATAAAPLKTGLKVFVIPKNLGNSYFTTSDSAKSGGAIAALNALKESGTETSGTAATPASQIPAIQAAITKGANVLLVSATDAAALCPTLNSAMQKGITVVTYDSDAPNCRDLYINQATPQGIGASEVDLLASEIGKSGQIAIVSAASSAPNQNTWIGYMKDELKKFPKMTLVKIAYGERRSDHLDAGHAGSPPAVPEPEGDHLPDHGRDRGSGRRARHREVPRQGSAHRARHAELDEEVCERRDGQGVRALESG